MTDQPPSASLYLQSASRRGDELPALLRSTTRSGSSDIDPLLAGLIVEKSYSIGAATRGGPPGEKVGIAAESNRVLALEAEDGTTIFIHADQLNADVARLRPEAMTVDGAVDLERFRDPNAASRGFGDVVWKAISVLRLPADGLAEEAMALARDWAIEQAAGALGEPVQGKLLDSASFLGAKALMWKIESRLAGRPGLYRWHDKTIAAADYCPPDAPGLAQAKAGQPMLLLIHGTGSYSVGGFADLRDDQTTWKALEDCFPGGIFGYEHRTFSQSPPENAVEILNALPPGARVSILSHSRGGLVGDLLCLGQVGEPAIAAYRIATDGASDPAGLEREAAEERQRLRQIVRLLGERRISVERYVRVACPARGTRFLSDNLDVALSDFLNLMKWGGGALVGVVAGALGGPAAAESFGHGASSAFGVVNRLILEIAGRRIDPRMIPGIAAMRVDSPLAAFLAHPETRRRDGIAMAVIAGDTEFSGLGLNNLGRRVANLFCDWRLFDDYDNDLVVDTDSMYAGLGFQAGTGYLYDQGEAVTHFRYFFNPSTRDAVHAWLADDAARLERFEILAAGDQEPWKERDRRVERGGERAPRPVVILLPGIMGSHIARHDKNPKDIDRIWFNVFRLGFGQLSRIADIADPQAFAEDIWERIYGDLADYLGASHDVVRCPYDWRQPVGICADALQQRIASALQDNPGQPIRLLAHSMGGLVARCLMQKYPESWQAVVASGGRLVMLGTPNNGAHLMVHTLLGKTSSMRGLEKLDTQHDLQEVLDIVGGFPGALTLLPRPAWSDVGSEPRLPTAQYYLADTWQDLQNCNTDRWYGDHIGALPSAEFLGLAKAFWDFLPRNEVPDPERVCYVFGQGEKTPCGVVKTADGHLQLLFTSEGDGSVTWASGRLDNLPDDERGWYMPIEHGDLASVEEHFPAILDLITRGTTDQLERLPQTRGAAAATFVLDAPPPVIPSADELARALIGSAPRRRQRPPRAGLAVSVLAGDLRFVDQPVICGHYIGDPIAAAEAILDKELDGRLSERERLGVYAGEIGTAAIVLPPRSAGQSLRDSRPGAIIVGLGDFNGQLGARQISETVRTAVLRLLLLLRDTSALGSETPIRLYSLLLGGNSTTHISVDESVAAVTCGVLEANNQFAQVVAKSEFPGMPVATLTFIDIYRDVAITAAHAVAELPRTLASQLRALNAELDVARSLEIGKGVRERLAAGTGQGYWSRLIITDADAPDSNAPAEGDAAAGRPPLPPERLPGLAAQPPDGAAGETRYLPERLKYVFLSQRARAETLVQQRQPGLIEAIIRKQRLTNTPNPQLGQTLFQLMVPVAYKSAARESPRLLLILDSYTASLPWELLQADDEPLAIRSPMVRQLITARFRGMVPTANSNSACIIAAPSTYGYHRRFGGQTEALAELPGAIREGEAIRDKLREARWSTIVCGPDGREAIDVLADLYHAPYRLLAICGHGIFEAQGVDGRSYSGVVLSDGLLITAVEIGLMEVVPEVVFLSCCHLGSMSHAAAQPNRLAYSLARELIDIGVRCVVAAGWAVDDAAAETFATVFFAKLTTGDAFGDAVFAARVATYDQHRATNTWGAYQAYGDPAYRLGPRDGQGQESNRRYMAVEELLDQLENRRISHATRAGRQAPTSFASDSAWVRRELARCPPEWASRPEVLQALGRLYAELGDGGFEAAREAYLAALQGDDGAGRVGCQVIEQLANLEARCGDKLIDQGRAADGLALLDSAAHRLQGLDSAVDGQPARKNPERAALLGSTLKRQAAAQAKLGKPGWKAIAATLDAAAVAYRKAGGESASDSYNTLNALAFAWLAGHLPITPEAGAELARRCGEEASRRFAASKSFWDAVGTPDAAVVAWLLSGKTADPGEQLRTAYRQLAREVPHTAREWDSVATQLQLLARFLELRQQAGDGERAALLKQLADPETAPPAAAPASGRRRKPTTKKAG